MAPESADIIYNNIFTPPDLKRIVCFEKTEHDMFRDCQREAAAETVVKCVRTRTGLTALGPVSE